MHHLCQQLFYTKIIEISLMYLSLQSLEYKVAKRLRGYLYFDSFLFLRQAIHKDIYFTSFFSYLSDSNKNDYDFYRNIGEVYIGFENYNYGNIYIGRTPSVYYNGFVGGWLDYGITGGVESLDPYAYGDYLGTRAVSNAIFYVSKIDNMKIAIQIAGNNNNSYGENNAYYKRSYNSGIGLVYAYGPLQIGLSYIRGKYHALNIQSSEDIFYVDIFAFGMNFDYNGIYSAGGFFMDKNRWYIGNTSNGFHYLFRYNDFNLFSKKLVPQIAYSYKYYYTTDLNNNYSTLPDSYIYLSLIYFMSTKFSVFLESKLDIRSASKIDQLESLNLHKQYGRSNRVIMGVGYEF